MLTNTFLGLTTVRQVLKLFEFFQEESLCFQNPIDYIVSEMSQSRIHTLGLYYSIITLTVTFPRQFTTSFVDTNVPVPMHKSHMTKCNV